MRKLTQADEETDCEYVRFGCTLHSVQESFLCNSNFQLCIQFQISKDIKFLFIHIKTIH